MRTDRGWRRFYATGWLVSALFGAVAAVQWQARLKEAEARAAQAERTLDEAARRRAVEERLRIARELHDLVAHSLTTIAIQSSTGRLALPAYPDVAMRALAIIETTSRAASREMRQLLGVLRQDGDSSAQLDPPPGLANLDELAESMRQAGADVSVTVEGRRRPLSRSLDLVAYRVVQEALTNVIKHAGTTTHVDVNVTHLPGSVAVEVVDDGRGLAAHPRNGSTAVTHGDGAGQGLIGMRERVELWGGQLSVGPVAGTMYMMYYGVISFADGFVPGVKAFTAAVLGGIGSLPGAVLGGLLIGLIEALWSAYFTIDYKDVATFSILAIALIFKPSGILGRPEVEKV